MWWWRGTGGVGSWTAEALARSGVGTLTLIDLDNVAESNINRQDHALISTVGMARRRHAPADCTDQPHCVVHCVEDFVTPENWLELLPAGAHVVIDACDQVKAKLAMAVQRTCRRYPFIAVGPAGGKRHRSNGGDVDDAVRLPRTTCWRNCATAWCASEHATRRVTAATWA